MAAIDIARLVAAILANPALHVGERYVVTGPLNMAIEDWSRLLTEEVGLPKLLVTHLKAV